MYPFSNECNRPRLPSCVVEHPQLDLGVPPQDNLPMPMPQYHIRYQPWWKSPPENPANKAGKKFQLNIDLQQFKPQDISVKTANGFIVVEARHGEREDLHGFISRDFSRRYQLPESIDPGLVISQLSSEGILNITAPLRVPPRSDNERSVPIVRTGPVRELLGVGGQ